MTRGKPASNPLDAHLDLVMESMRAQAEGIDRLAEGVPDFDAKRLTPDEEELAYANPAGVFFPDEVDPASGLPLSNVQAAQRLLATKGAQWYVGWVEENESRRAKEGADG